MSKGSFLRFLQSIITMVDPKDESSVALGYTTLVSLISMANSSHKVDAFTLHLMRMAVLNYEGLIMHQEDFAGIPGDYHNNVAKRHRLEHAIRPGC